MRSLQAPQWAHDLPVGSMGFSPNAATLGVYLRLDEWLGSTLPRVCEISPRLVAWDAPPVFVSALLIRLKDDERLTYETWIHAGTREGLFALKRLATERDLALYVVTDHAARRYLIRNLTGSTALDLYRRAVDRADLWNPSHYDKLFADVARRYGTVRQLWRASMEAPIHDCSASPV
jgi:hypothetical protein